MHSVYSQQEFPQARTGTTHLDTPPLANEERLDALEHRGRAWKLEPDLGRGLDSQGFEEPHWGPGRDGSSGLATRRSDTETGRTSVLLWAAHGG